MRRSTLGLATRASSSLFLSSSSAASVASTRRRGVVIHHQYRFQHPAASFSSSPASSSSRTDTEPQVKPPSIPLIQRVLQVFGYGESLKRTKYSESLLQSCIAQTNNTQFYRAGRISDSFRSSHGLLVAHVWMVHKRLLLEGEEGKVLEEALFDRLWEETTNRIRSLKVNELSVNSYVKEVQAYSFGACVSYDASQAIENEQERVDELAGALYRYVYLRDEHLMEDHVLELAKYIQRELDSLKTLPKEAIFQSRFKWGPLPSWKKRPPRYITSQGRQLSDEDVLGVKREGEGDDASVASPSTAAFAAVEGGKGGGDKKEEEEEGDLRGEWRTAFSENGRMYYWNVRQCDNQIQFIMSAEEQTKKRKDVEGGEEEAPPAKRQEEEEEEVEEESVDSFEQEGEDVSDEEELPFSNCTHCGKPATRMALLHGFNYKTGVCGSCQPLGEGDWGDDDDDEEYEGDEGEEEKDEEDEDEEADEEEGDDDGEEEEEDGEEEAGEEEEDEEVAVAEKEEGLSKAGSAAGSGSRKVAVGSSKESQ